MDPMQYQFTPNAVIPQESKLATYMSRPPLRSNLSSPPSSSNRKDFLQNAFFGLDISGSRETSIHISSPQLSSTQTSTQLSSNTLTAAQLSASQLNTAPMNVVQLGSNHVSGTQLNTSHLNSVHLNVSQLSSTQIATTQMAGPIHQVLQENVGGTTYFYPASTTQEQSSISQQSSSSFDSQNLLVSSSPIDYSIPTFYPRSSTEINAHPPAIRTGLTSFYLPEDVREEIMTRNEIAQIQADPLLYPEMPVQVENYIDLMPHDRCSLNTLHSCYRAVNSIHGNLVLLRRLHDFRLSTKTCPTSIEKWKYLQHPNVVRLREVFTSKEFGDTSLIFVYDFHPGSSTLAQQYTIPGNESRIFGDFSSDPDAPRPYSHQKNSLLRAVHGGNLLPESIIWSFIIQLTAALKNIHSAGLACRNLDPSKVIIAGNRLRLAWCGVDEIAGAIGGGSGAVTTEPEVAQQEDLTALGKLVLFLACRTMVPIDLTHSQVQYIMRAYSPDLKNLVLYLLTISPRRSVIDLMPMIGARFYTQIEALEKRVDTMESELATEMDNTRLLNLLVKLSTVNERPDLNMDAGWAETGERYILKLFRDYLFHSVTADGKPWLDYSHLVYNLNQLDAGTHHKVQLMSRDEKIILIVTFAELRRALELSYNEVKEAAETNVPGA